MLARGTKSVYVCLRCQRNLHGITFNRSKAGETAIGHAPRRWQSAAAQVVAPEEVDDTHDDKKEDGEGPHRSPNQGQQRPERDGHTYRIWKPSSTAELGVNSLGKPAEVLILPSRDRRIAQAPKDDETRRAGKTLQESIDSEKAPLSGAKLAENIEQVHSLIGKMRGQLERHEWKTLKKHLRSGFQTAQLARYIRLRKGESFPPAGLSINSNKDEIITYMAEEIWGFTIPMRDSTSTSHVPEKKTTLSYSMRGDTTKLDHLLTHTTQPLKRIAEERNVQINVYPSQTKITVIGPTHDANTALQRVVAWVEGLAKLKIPLQGSLGLSSQGLRWKLRLGAHIASLQRKYQGLSIGVDKEGITIVHLANPRAADQARREILLSAPLDPRRQNLSVWPQMNESTASLQPCHTPAELPPLLQYDQWYRLLSSSVNPLTLDRAGRSALFGNVLRGLRDALTAYDSLLTASNRQDPFYNIMARFGQSITQDVPLSAGSFEKEISKGKKPGAFDAWEFAEVLKEPPAGEITTARPALSQSEQRALMTTEPSGVISPDARVITAEDPTNEDTPPPAFLGASEDRVFVGGPPFVPQCLSRMSPWKPATSAPAGERDGSAHATLRLELCPSSTQESKGSPGFEIFVTVGGKANCQNPQLSLVTVSAIHHEDHFTVLCPQNVVDVKFTRQFKQDLMYPGGAEMALLQQLMNTLRGYVGRAQSAGSADWVFPPFVILPIDPTLKDVYRRSRQSIMSKSDKPPESTRPEAKKLEYLLRTVDVVDVDSRDFSVQSSSSRTSKQTKLPNKSSFDFCVEHVTYTGADVTRQELRLARSPMLHAPTLNPTGTLPFLKAALKLAEIIGRHPLDQHNNQLDVQHQFVAEVDDIDEKEIIAKDYQRRTIERAALLASKKDAEALTIRREEEAQAQRIGEAKTAQARMKERKKAARELKVQERKEEDTVKSAVRSKVRRAKKLLAMSQARAEKMEAILQELKNNPTSPKHKELEPWQIKASKRSRSAAVKGTSRRLADAKAGSSTKEATKALRPKLQETSKSPLRETETATEAVVQETKRTPRAKKAKSDRRNPEEVSKVPTSDSSPAPEAIVRDDKKKTAPKKAKIVPRAEKAAPQALSSGQDKGSKTVSQQASNERELKKPGAKVKPVTRAKKAKIKKVIEKKAKAETKTEPEPKA